MLTAEQTRGGGFWSRLGLAIALAGTVFAIYSVVHTVSLDKCREANQVLRERIESLKEENQKLMKRSEDEVSPDPSRIANLERELEQTKAELRECVSKGGGPPEPGSGKFFGATRQGAITHPGGSLRYSFSVSSRAKINVKIVGGGVGARGLQPHFAIFGPVGEKLGESGNGFLGVEEREIFLPGAGNYTLMVDGSQQSTGSYHLTVQCISGGCM